MNSALIAGEAYSAPALFYSAQIVLFFLYCNVGDIEICLLKLVSRVSSCVLEGKVYLRWRLV